MNLEELRSVRNTERQKDSLQELRPSFYQEVGEYIGNLEDERERVASQHDDPFASPEVTRLTDEIEAAKDVAEAIYERRMGKLVKQASLAAAGMTADSDGLTAEEEALFTDLVDRIEENKAEILSVLDGDAPAESDADPSRAASSETAGRTDVEPNSETDSTAPPAPPMDDRPAETEPSGDDGFSVADAMGSEPGETAAQPTGSTAEDEVSDADASSRDDRPDPSSERETAGEDVDRVTVQITTDVGQILGVDDREYTLASDDVVTLPEANADPLIERDAAEPLE